MVKSHELNAILVIPLSMIAGDLKVATDQLCRCDPAETNDYFRLQERVLGAEPDQALYTLSA